MPLIPVLFEGVAGMIAAIVGALGVCRTVLLAWRLIRMAQRK